MEDTIVIENSEKSECQIFGYVHQNTNGPNRGPAWKTQSFLLSEICTVILCQYFYGKGNSRKFYWNTVGKKVPNWECLFLNREKRLFLSLFLSVCVDDIKLARKKQNIDPMWKVLYKEVDLGEPTSFLDHVYLVALKENAKRAKILWTITETCFESRISAGAKEKQPCSGKPDADISSWSYDMEGHAKKSVERYCELANKTNQQLYKVTTPCLDDLQFKEEESGFVGDLSIVYSPNVLKCLYLARIGRLDIPWSVNKLVRSVTKWNRACARRFGRLILKNHHTREFKHNCHVGHTAQQCRLGLFQDFDFARDLKASKSTS